MNRIEQSLASPVIRRCANCAAPAMVNSCAKDISRFHCTVCGATIELWSWSTIALSLVFSIALLSLLLLDDHLFWLLMEIFADPLKTLPAMRVDGLFAPISIPLVLIAINILIVGLPLLSLSYALHTLYTRWRNPVVTGVEADEALAGYEIAPAPKKQRFTRGELFRAALIALAFHAAFVAVASIVLVYGNREAFEDLVKQMLPAVLLSGGVFFGVRRWMMATIWVILLPVSGFVIAILSGQLS